jgi:hypothetical protein
MAQQVCVVLNAVEREQLVRIAADRNRRRRRIERAQCARHASKAAGPAQDINLHIKYVRVWSCDNLKP